VVFDVEVGVVGFEGFDFGAVADEDVGVVGIFQGVILVVVFAGVEGLQGRDLGDDGVGEGVVGGELRDVGFGDALLVGGVEEDGGTVGGSFVGALAVEGGGVVDGEEDAEELAVGDAGGVEDDFDGFGVVGGFGGDLIVGGSVGCSTRVAGGGFDDALDALEHGLRAPETASCEDCGFTVGGGGQGDVDFGGRDGTVGCGRAGEGGKESEERQREEGAEGAEWGQGHRLEPQTF
jgi:hypothetical protein